jgi:uncharacterized protein (DUF924 family)
MNQNDILQFWFHEIQPAQIWTKDVAFDQLIIDRFSDVYQQATHCELYPWRQSADGCLAEIIVLDQFSRNMFRDSPLAFKFDALALSLAQHAVASGIDKQVDKDKRSFIYLPFMHSESLVIHKQALKIYQEHGVQGSLDFEIKHKNIIDKFGRYPHRNAVLGRQSTDEEIGFLKGPNSSF